MRNARRLSQKELTMLHKALETAAKWMQWWLDQRECECEGCHICGRNEREEELKKIQAAESLLAKLMETSCPVGGLSQQIPEDGINANDIQAEGMWDWCEGCENIIWHEIKEHRLCTNTYLTKCSVCGADNEAES